MLSRPVINATVILRYNPLAHEIYTKQYAKDDNFKEVYDSLTHGKQQSYYYMHDPKSLSIGFILSVLC